MTPESQEPVQPHDSKGQPMIASHSESRSSVQAQDDFSPSRWSQSAPWTPAPCVAPREQRQGTNQQRAVRRAAARTHFEAKRVDTDRRL